MADQKASRVIGVTVPGLREVRRRKLWSQQQTADAANVARATITRGERGGPISMENVRKLATALGVEAEELLSMNQQILSLSIQGYSLHDISARLGIDASKAKDMLLQALDEQETNTPQDAIEQATKARSYYEQLEADRRAGKSVTNQHLAQAKKLRDMTEAAARHHNPGWEPNLP